MTKTYENKYGKLVIEVISSYGDVTKMAMRDADPTAFFTLEQSEQIALITANKGIQIAFSKIEGSYRASLLHHESPELAAWCRVVELHYVGKKAAQEEIEDAARKHSSFCPIT